jgi:hypothetical protein
MFWKIEWKKHLSDSKFKVTMIVDNSIRYEGVSKYVTNGSKTAVMGVIGFLSVSLGSSTVQLHDSLGSRHTCTCSEAGFSSQNGDRA